MSHESAALWYLIAGAIFSLVALAGPSIRHLPLSMSLLYLVTGLLLGPSVAGLLDVHLPRAAWWIERATELAVGISLFSTGLHLRAPWRDPRWRQVLRLGAGVTAVTALLMAATLVSLLGLSWGAALLLGGLLAPTDPVLARDVQLAHPHDRSPLRFALTGEAGLNDGAAFPIVLLGLGLLHAPLPAIAPRWLLVDLAWATLSGLLAGWMLGTLLGRLILHLRRRHQQAVGLDHFVALGLIGASYGLAILLHGYGFLAIFAAGLALRRVELGETGEHPPDDLMQVAAAPSERAAVATDEETAPVYLAQTSLRFTELLEQIAEAFVVTLVGAMLTHHPWAWRELLALALLFVGIRPLAVWLLLAGTDVPRRDRALIGWFGIRGIASIYYAAYAITHGLPDASIETVTRLALGAVAMSSLLHGVSVTPLMAACNRGPHKGRPAGEPSADDPEAASPAHPASSGGHAGIARNTAGNSVGAVGPVGRTAGIESSAGPAGKHRVSG